MVRRLSVGARRPAGLVRAAVAALALLVVAGCSSSVAGSPVAAPATGGPATTESAPPTGTSVAVPPTGPTDPTGPTADSGSATASSSPVPAGLEQFYGQQLQWGPCTDFGSDDETKAVLSSADLQCSHVTVPMEYDKPDGEQVEIAVLKAAATGDRIGSAVFNFGGPGVGGAAEMGQIAAAGYAKDLRERFDLVGFDPRGTGSSTPAITCRTDAERDADRAANNRLRTPEEIAEADARVEQQVRNCIERTGSAGGVDGATFLGTIGTRDVAKDLDILRSALGDPLLTYVGYSYGTQIGSVYAETFPDNVRAMVLDGAVDPTADKATNLLNQAAGFQKAFDNFAAWCAQRADCVLGKDPALATEVYQTLLKPLLDEPLKVSDGRVLTAADAITGTIQALYAEAFWEALARGLSDLSQGNGDVLMAIADQYEGRDQNGHYETTLDSLVAIRCMDDPRVSREESQHIAEQYVKAAPFTDLGDPVVATANTCDFWPAEPTLSPRMPQVDGLAPVVVVSTTNDPATPYEAGVKLAEALHGSLLTIDGTRHTGFLLSGITCADELGTDYLINLTLPPEGTVCS